MLPPDLFVDVVGKGTPVTLVHRPPEAFLEVVGDRLRSLP